MSSSQETVCATFKPMWINHITTKDAVAVLNNKQHSYGWKMADLNHSGVKWQKNRDKSVNHAEN